MHRYLIQSHALAVSHYLCNHSISVKGNNLSPSIPSFEEWQQYAIPLNSPSILFIIIISFAPKAKAAGYKSCSLKKFKSVSDIHLAYYRVVAITCIRPSLYVQLQVYLLQLVSFPSAALVSAAKAIR